MSPDVLDKLLSRTSIDLPWEFWIEILGIDSDQHGLDEGPLALRTVYQELMLAWFQIVCVYVEVGSVLIVLAGWASQLLEVTDVFDVDIRQLVHAALVMDHISPTNEFVEDTNCFKRLRPIIFTYLNNS